MDVTTVTITPDETKVITISDVDTITTTTDIVPDNVRPLACQFFVEVS